MDSIKYLFLDLEDTSLDPNTGHILEVGAIGVTKDLVPLFEVETLVRPSRAAFNSLAANPAAAVMHEHSGLTDELWHHADDDKLPTVTDIEDYLLALLDRHSATGTVALAGSGVAHHDMPYLAAHMPRLYDRLDYQPLDISDIRRAYHDATGMDISRHNDLKPHRAFDDVQLHLEQARIAFTMMRSARTVSEPLPRDGHTNLLTATALVRAHLQEDGPASRAVLNGVGTADVLAGLIDLVQLTAEAVRGTDQTLFDVLDAVVDTYTKTYCAPS